MASRILLVDNSITIQKVVIRTFAEEGIEVVAIGNGEFAKQRLAELNPDLVLASITLPLVSGYELCDYIKNSPDFRHMPVILLVGMFEPFDKAAAARVGADAHMIKPFDSRSLIDTARRLIHKSKGPTAPLSPTTDIESEQVVAEDPRRTAPLDPPAFVPEEPVTEPEIGPTTDNAPPVAESLPKENPPQQSGFFKPYVPPQLDQHNLTADDADLEGEPVLAPALAGDKASRQRQPPESAFLVVWTAICIMLLAAALVVWQATRTNPVQTAASSDTETPAVAEQGPTATTPVADAQPPDQEKAAGEAAAGGESPTDLVPNPVPEQGSSDKINPSVTNEAREATRPAPAAAEDAETAPARKAGRDTTPVQSAQAPVGRANYAIVRERMLARARQLEDQQLLEQAEKEYKAILSNHPGDAAARFGLSRVEARLSAARQNDRARASREAGLRAFRMGDNALAAAELSAAVKAGRADTAVLYSLGMSNLKLGRHAEAQAALTRCLTASPNYAPAMVGLAQSRAATGNKEAAIRLLQRALDLGGGAEFTPERIREMIARLSPRAASAPPPRGQN